MYFQWKSILQRVTKHTVFESVVTIVYQNEFRSEIYENNVFLFLKNYFWHQHIKTIQEH